MLNKILRILVSSAVIVAMMSMAGCEALSTYSTKSQDDTVYSAQFPLSDYSMFLNKEIEPVTNQLTTHMLIAKNVAKGEYPSKDALASAKDSLKIVQECKHNVDTMQPSREYEEDRDSVLRTLTNIEDTFYTYIDELESDSLSSDNLEALSDVMKSDYEIITSLFNVPRK